MAANSKPTQFYATLSTSIVLVLISLFLLIFFHSANITNIVKENINILVELEDNQPSGQVQHLKDYISSLGGVLPGSVKFVSKEEAVSIMSRDLNMSGVGTENPFKDLISFNLNSTAYSDALIRDIKTKVELEKGVLGLYYENESVDLIRTNLEKVSMAILLLALCFVVLALAIIFNTVKLTLYADIKQIRTMKMVGAENSFIKNPYLLDAFFMTLKAVAAVAVFVGLLCFLLMRSGSVFAEIIQWKYVFLTVAICFVAALVIQLLTTNAIISRFLRLER